MARFLFCFLYYRTNLYASFFLYYKRFSRRYNGYAEEFCTNMWAIDTNTMASVMRTNVQNKRSLNGPKLLLIVQCRSKYLHRSSSSLSKLTLPITNSI